MSGGVDSSATAALLLEQGYDVVGITLKLWPQDCVSRAEDKCCGPQAVTDARAVCHKLGIPYYLIDEAAEFQSKVIQYFADEYKAGRTPNPCVMCNQNLKFGRLIERADQLGAQYRRHRPFCAGGRRARTAPGRCSSAAATCARTRATSCSPCGRINWPARCFPWARRPRATRAPWLAHCQLKTADKEESMEICFVPDNDYGKFLQQAKLVQKHRGEIVNLQGQVLGQHDGIEFYTIGQRKGLGISSPKPLYVIELDAAKNRVVVGDDSALLRDEFVVERCNWIAFDAPPATLDATVKIRYNHPGALATVTPLPGGAARVKLHVPQRAITAGQAAVFYQDDLVVGGGWIAA